MSQVQYTNMPDKREALEDLFATVIFDLNSIRATYLNEFEIFCLVATG